MKALSQSLAYNEVFDVVLSIWSVLEIKGGAEKIGWRCFESMGYSASFPDVISARGVTRPVKLLHKLLLFPSSTSAFLQPRGLFIYTVLPITYLFCFSYFSACWKKQKKDVCVCFQASWNAWMFFWMLHY